MDPNPARQRLASSGVAEEVTTATNTNVTVASPMIDIFDEWDNGLMVLLFWGEVRRE